MGLTEEGRYESTYPGTVVAAASQAGRPGARIACSDVTTPATPQ